MAHGMHKGTARRGWAVSLNAYEIFSPCAADVPDLDSSYRRMRFVDCYQWADPCKVRPVIRDADTGHRRGRQRHHFDHGSTRVWMERLHGSQLDLGTSADFGPGQWNRGVSRCSQPHALDAGCRRDVQRRTRSGLPGSSALPDELLPCDAEDRRRWRKRSSRTLDNGRVLVDSSQHRLMAHDYLECQRCG
jgi:hypothetical protein